MSNGKRAPGRDSEAPAGERANVAHQLNNALAIILGNTQVALLEVETASKAAGHLREILAAAHRARELVRAEMTLPPPAPGESGTHQLGLEAAREPAREGASARPPALHPRILYIDDEEALVLLAVRHLERLGYKVTGATSAERALELFRRDPASYAAVMTDLNMPGMSGLSLAAQMLSVRADLPMIIVSGFVSEELLAEAAAIGVRHVVYKPSTVEELAGAVHSLLATPHP